MKGGFGICGRLDTGGLATQSYEAIKHLKPDKVLIADLQGARGPIIYNEWPEKTTFAPSLFTREVVEKFLEGLTTVLAFEASYGPELCQAAARMGARVVLQANPELRVPHEWHGATIVAPTDWEHDRNPSEQILPVPINREILPFRLRTKAETFYHIAAPAMLDRNGTQIVLDACKFVRNPCRLIVRGASSEYRWEQIGKVSVDFLPFEARPYYELWPEEADVLLLPRRYGGLCLPAQEGASLGLPLLTLDIPPLHRLPFVYTTTTLDSQKCMMKGGLFKVYSAAPHDLAGHMDALMEHPQYVERASQRADIWAEERSWSNLLPDYEKLLGLSKREKEEPNVLRKA